MKLIVCDPLSIAYVKLKHMEGLKIFVAHVCNCDQCQLIDYGNCPYCEECIQMWNKPTIDYENAQAYTGKCPECGEHFLKSVGAKIRIKDELAIFNTKK